MNAEPGAGEPQAKDPLSQPAPNQTFVLRLWRAAVDEHRAEWRGRLQQVTTGETRYFRTWPALLAQLQALLGTEPRRDEAALPGEEPAEPGSTPPG